MLDVGSGGRAPSCLRRSAAAVECTELRSCLNWLLFSLLWFRGVSIMTRSEASSSCLRLRFAALLIYRSYSSYLFDGLRGAPTRELLTEGSILGNEETDGT